MTFCGQAQVRVAGKSYLHRGHCTWPRRNIPFNESVTFIDDPNSYHASPSELFLFLSYPSHFLAQVVMHRGFIVIGTRNVISSVSVSSHVHSSLLCRIDRSLLKFSSPQLTNYASSKWVKPTTPVPLAPVQVHTSQQITQSTFKTGTEIFSCFGIRHTLPMTDDWMPNSCYSL